MGGSGMGWWEGGRALACQAAKPSAADRPPSSLQPPEAGARQPLVGAELWAAFSDKARLARLNMTT